MRNSTDVPAGPRTSNAALRRTAGRIAPLLAGTLLALPSTIPWAGIESLTWALLARSACLVRVSAGEPTTVPLFLEALAEEYPPLARTAAAGVFGSARPCGGADQCETGSAMP